MQYVTGDGCQLFVLHRDLFPSRAGGESNILIEALVNFFSSSQGMQLSSKWVGKINLFTTIATNLAI